MRNFSHVCVIRISLSKNGVNMMKLRAASMWFGWSTRDKTCGAPGPTPCPDVTRYDDITITSGDDHVPKSCIFLEVTLIYRLHPSNFSSCNMEQMGVVRRIYASPGRPSVSRPSNPFTSTPILNYRPPSIIVSELKDSNSSHC
ncbi:hypothetical protein RSAG8_06021, partial [Rhizoctonia solani AG-8 WAC10335]